MSAVVEFRGVSKRYGRTVALSDVTLALPARSIVGLVGRNGSGKTTLLRHATGQVLPDAGTCITFGRSASRLGRRELARIGAVHQDDPLLEWMRAEQLLEYVASFYERWDVDLQRALVASLELDVRARVGALSPGARQKLALVLATCHRPALLLLDEPLSDLDPIARQAVLAMLLDRFSSDAMTIVISSHMLRDIEPVIDRVVCLEAGRVVADDALDDLQERYAEWIVTSPAGRLPATYREAYVESARGDAQRAQLVVRDADAQRERFAAAYDATIETRALSLERIFPLLVGAARAGDETARAAAGGATSPRDGVLR
jgi:ABC-2 type transport system ATP-binding protein